MPTRIVLFPPDKCSPSYESWRCTQQIGKRALRQTNVLGSLNEATVGTYNAYLRAAYVRGRVKRGTLQVYEVVSSTQDRVGA